MIITISNSNLRKQQQLLLVSSHTPSVPDGILDSNLTGSTNRRGTKVRFLPLRFKRGSMLTRAQQARQQDCNNSGRAVNEDHS
eukprot:991489-Pelagomonas_calceolata.AAC.3